MVAALVGNHPVKPRIHSFRTNEFTRSAPGQQFAQSGGLKLVGVDPLTQQVDALLQYRAQAAKTPGLDQRPCEGVLFVCE